MNKRNAIKALRLQNNKLVNEGFEFGSSWIIQTQSYLADMISAEDILTIQFNDVVSSLKYCKSKGIDEDTLNGYKRQFSNILQSTIEKIQNTGLKLSERNNFLYRVKDSILIPLFTILVPGIFTVGTIWGKYLSDTQNIELKIELKKLKESKPEVLKPQKQSDLHSDSSNAIQVK